MLKHRAGSSKIKYEHHMILGLRKLLEQIEPWEEIKSIIPAAISPTRGRAAYRLKVQYLTPTGLKCLARSGSSVQEIFLVTSKPQELRQRLEQFLRDG